MHINLYIIDQPLMLTHRFGLEEQIFYPGVPSTHQLPDPQTLGIWLVLYIVGEDILPWRTLHPPASGPPNTGYLASFIYIRGRYITSAYPPLSRFQTPKHWASGWFYI